MLRASIGCDHRSIRLGAARQPGWCGDPQRQRAAEPCLSAVLRVDASRNIPEVSPSVICLVAIDVIDLRVRQGASHAKESDPMGVRPKKLDVAVLSTHTACNATSELRIPCVVGSWRSHVVAESPEEDSGYRVVRNAYGDILFGKIAVGHEEPLF